MNKKTCRISLLLLLICCAFLTTGCTPGFVRGCNNYNNSLQKAYDESDYKTKKKVEDTCRAMISSYKSDKLIYEQYKNSEDKNEKSWSNQAKIRANKTATSYNEYILKNTHIWKDNIPSDIYIELEIIE